MEATEFRTLDGPNLFLLQPAIKLEFVAGDDERASDAALGLVGGDAASGPLGIAEVARRVILHSRDACGMPEAEIVVRTMDEPGHAAVAMPWTRRRGAEALMRAAWAVVAGDEPDLDAEVVRIRELLAAEPTPDDVPEMMPDSRRQIPVIGITGTNGKTTTTRLTTSILRRAGRKVGWTSSSGVMIGEDCVLPGDYTGPAGAARVFEEPGLDIAVLETARGGILLRGLGYEHNDVSVMTNISPDHMGLHGVHTLDLLTEVKSVVVRVTRADGRVVLNADDPRVLALREHITAPPFLFSRAGSNEAVAGHIAEGGWALTIGEGAIVWHHDGARDDVVALADVPITFGGRAAHMVENAMAAAAALLAIGLPLAQVADGLRVFRNRPAENRGRLNVFTRDGATVIVDFAHNEAGLEHLVTFGRTFCEEGGKLVVAIGTAGDRDDAAITGVGRLAAEHADEIIVKDTEKYLRGRTTGEMPALLRPIVAKKLVAETPSERAAFYLGLERLTPGDVLAVMTIEDYDEILAYLESNATLLS